MPGTPATTPNLGLPRYSNADAADFASDVNALADAIDLAAAPNETAPPIGALVAYAGSGDPAGGTWLLADGRLVDKTTYADFFTAVGHDYNGGVDPGSNKVRLPDKRGRGSIGADNMGTAQGAAGRLPNSNRARGQNGGLERVALSTSEMPVHSHVPPGGFFVSEGNTSTGSAPSTWTGSASTRQLYGATNNAGSGSSHNNMHPYEIDNMIVRVA